MNEALHNELERIKGTAGGFYAWGAEPRGRAGSTWRKMARGDYVLTYYFKGYHYVARALASFHEPTLARNMWGTNENTGETWEYLYFLTVFSYQAYCLNVAGVLGVGKTPLSSDA
jgi:hypothetical protein